MRTPTTTKEKVGIMQAFLNGRTIICTTFRHPSSQHEFTIDTCAEPVWNWGASDYKIKPNPKRIWMIKDLGVTNSPVAAQIALDRGMTVEEYVRVEK